ncbi:MAG: hypothetical protein U0941_27015 [Planctomycetaceae bacterium]
MDTSTFIQYLFDDFDADFECQYMYVVKAISRCTGRFDQKTQSVTGDIEKIKFAPPHKPK